MAPKMGDAGIQVGGGVQQVAGDQVVRVFAEFVRGQCPCQVLDGVGVEEQQQDAADDFQDAVETLEHQADLEGRVQRRRQRLGRRADGSDGVVIGISLPSVREL